MWIGAVVAALLYSQALQEVAKTPAAQETPTTSLAEQTTPAEQAAEAALQAAKAAQTAAQAAQKAVELMEKTHGPAQAQAQAAAAAEAPPPSPWTTSANLNLIFLSGNSSSITLNGKVAVTYKTENWIFGGQIYGAYGRARLEKNERYTDIALQGGVDLRVDRRFVSMLSGYVLGGVDFDHIKSIESRPFAELGVGVTWLDNKVDSAQKTLLTTDFGLRYAYEARFRYYPTDAEIPLLDPADVPTEPRNLPNVDILAPRAAVAFRYMLTDGIGFGEDLEVLLNVLEVKRFWLNSTTKISVRLTNIFSVSTALTFKYDSQPAGDAKKLDTILALGLDAVF
ncbi:MAG: DUF481 domain-containing protein [Proteobacteria bacterium]|nr:DUF481 domain-containing protein [Cystobacterineae bacterium]MCL2314872.1 DUF481 domain-containing protein [Pseudomonadota bacterium]